MAEGQQYQKANRRGEKRNARSRVFARHRGEIGEGGIVRAARNKRGGRCGENNGSISISSEAGVMAKAKSKRNSKKQRRQEMNENSGVIESVSAYRQLSKLNMAAHQRSKKIMAK